MDMGIQWSIPVIASFLILSIFGTSQQAEAATVIISDQASCEAQGGAIKTDKCFFSGSLTILSGDSWTSTLFLAVHDLTVEGELNAPNGMDADKLTNKGTITTVNLISIGPSNFWVNDCGGKINLLPNGIINFNAGGTNHGVINGDSTTAITTPLSSTTFVNSGIIQSSVTLNKVSIQDVSSPCGNDKKTKISESYTTQEKKENSQTKVDYIDSTGYTPFWAKNTGMYSVLNKCNMIIGETTRDGNWCFEWVTYVVDQGIENFPQSAESTSSTSSTLNLSERVCTKNQICAFPGDYLRYKNTDTWDGFSEIAIVEFKEKISDRTIRVFIDGFGSKPLTYNLDLKTGIETNSQYDLRRPFNLLEPVPMYEGQRVSQFVEGSFESTLGSEKTVSFGGKERAVMIGDYEETGLSVSRVYDKETGILVLQAEEYEIDGVWYKAEMSLLETNMFSEPIKIATKKTSTKEDPLKPRPTPIKMGEILSPKKQVAQGIVQHQVICKEGLQLIIKYNDSPACVKPETAEKLTERGWTSS